MPRYAQIDSSGNILNIAIWDGEKVWPQPDGVTVIEAGTMAIGGTYIDGVYTPPPPQQQEGQGE